MTDHAEFSKRLIAMLIDYLIVFGLYSLFFAGASRASGLAYNELSTAALAGIFSGQGMVFLLYHAVLESSRHQATWGKRLMKIVVTDREGERIMFGRAFIRTLGKYLSGAILFIGYAMALFTQERQALHDLLAGTLVLEEE